MVADIEHFHGDQVLAVECAAQQLFGERVFDPLLDGAAQRASPIIQVAAFVDDEFLGLVGEEQLHSLFVQAFAHLGQFNLDDVFQVLASQVTEDHDLVDAAQELRLELFLDFLHQPRLHALVGGVLILLGEPESAARLDDLGPRVRGHDQDDVAEVDFAAETVGQVAFFHDLQQHVVDVRVSLLDFVQQHDRVRAAANLLGELAPLFVADVAGRSADQAADVVLLHVLGHVDLHEGVFVAEHEFGEGF